MKEYKAIFLDRDGTLSHNSPSRERERDLAIAGLLGRDDFQLTAEMYMDAFWRVMDLGYRYPTLPEEDRFWTKVYELILRDEGAADNAVAMAAHLYDRFCFYRNMMSLYEETATVIEALKSRG